MYYEIHGATTARPLVTIHGFLGLRNVFPSLVNRQLIVLDLQGYGRSISTAPSRLRKMQKMSLSYLSTCESRRPTASEKASAVIVAMLIAARHPELVRRVAIYGTALGDRVEVTRPQSIAEFTSLTSGRMAMAWRGFPSEKLKSIQVPVLIAAGDHDILSPVLEHHRAMFRIIPDA